MPLSSAASRDASACVQGMFVLYLTLGYIFSIGIWARPLIVNETIRRRKKRKEAA